MAVRESTPTRGTAVVTGVNEDITSIDWNTNKHHSKYILHTCKRGRYLLAKLKDIRNRNWLSAEIAQTNWAVEK